MANLTYQNYLTLHYPSSIFADQYAFSSHAIDKILHARADHDARDTDLVYTNINHQWLGTVVNAMERKRLRCL